MFDPFPNNLLTSIEISQRYGINLNYLDYIGLRQSVLKMVKESIGNQLTVNQNAGTPFSELCLQKKTCRYTYIRLVNTLPREEKYKQKWYEELRQIYDKTIWENIH